MTETKKFTTPPKTALQKSKKELGTKAEEEYVSKTTTGVTRAALAMHIRDATDQEIAEELGFPSPAAARTAWQVALGRMVDSKADLSAVRAVAGGKLEAMMASLAPLAFNAAIDPGFGPPIANEAHLAYSQQYLRVLDRWIRLKGADAPQVMEIKTPATAEFEQVVQAMMRSINEGAAEEADIFEVGDDGETYQQRSGDAVE